MLTISHNRGTRMFRRIAIIGVVISAVAAGGCGNEKTGSREIQRNASTGTHGFDIHKVDWANATLPGKVCGFRRPIHLRHREAFVKAIPPRFPDLRANQRESHLPRGVAVYSGWNRPVYGNLDGKPGDEAGLVASCNNGGGTGGGALAYAWVIFTGRDGKLSPVGIVTPRVQRRHELPTTLLIKIKHGEIGVREFWYGYWDGTCCPSGRATATWTYSDGRLHPGDAVILKRPRKRPR
jgi:hypothetical protein